WCHTCTPAPPDGSGRFARLVKQAAITALIDGTERITKTPSTPSAWTTYPNSATGPVPEPSPAPGEPGTSHGWLRSRARCPARRRTAAGAWAQIPLPAPGVFRIRPLAFEATASYLQRLAGAYGLTLPQLLDSAGITVHGHGTPPAAGLDLSPTAARESLPWPESGRTPSRVHCRACSRTARRTPDRPPHTEGPSSAASKLYERARRACDTTAAARRTPPGSTGPGPSWCAGAISKPPPTHDSRPHCAPGPFPNSPRPTTATSGYNGIHGARMHGRQHTRSPPAGTTTNNTSPTTGTGACINSREPTRTWTAQETLQPYSWSWSATS
ncbi:hypothetical protein SAMN05216511_7207, partial [Streptomyces sp. KS_16]